MDRRRFLRNAAVGSASLGLGAGFWERALAAPATPGPSPYGPLLAPDANGLRLPAGFTSRVVAASLLPVQGTTHLWHAFPDGGACVPTEDGGWIYVSNSEFPPPTDIPVATSLLATLGLALAAVPGLPVLPATGGVGAIRFDASGAVVDAYPVLTGSLSNCAGGLTPWGTWLSCEEWEDAVGLGAYGAGLVWECDPFGEVPAAPRPDLGRFKHEMAACDPVRQRIYLTEDQPDGLLYRYTPAPGTWGSSAALSGGVLEAMRIGPGGGTTWLPVPNAANPSGPLRSAVPGATPFDGGEGCLYDDGRVYITTKGDDRVWVHDVEAATMVVLYDAADHASPVLTGVDNLAVTASHDLLVAEDGGDLEVVTITPEGVVASVVQMTGPQHGAEGLDPLPLVSEVTGLALSPDGNRLYFNSERGNGIAGLPIGPGPGILYEVTGPFRGGTLAAAAGAPPTTTTTTTTTVAGPQDDGRPVLPITGGGTSGPAAALAGVAGLALLRLRNRARTGDA